MLMRSRLYVPGNQPRMLINAGVYGADIVVLDLEDSVPNGEKDSARDLVSEAVWSLDFGRSAVFIRVNSEREMMELDVKALSEACAGVLMPKAESLEGVNEVSEALSSIEKELGLEDHFIIIPIIESARGLASAGAIAEHPRVQAMTLGVEDLSADLGMPAKDDEALLYARSRIIASARAGGAVPLDTVYGSFRDEEGLYNACIRSRAMGFEGRGAIHPNQLDIIHSAFMPTDAEIEWANRVVDASASAERDGKGAVDVDGAMVDPPVVRRAERILAVAGAPGPGLDLDPVEVDE